MYKVLRYFYNANNPEINVSEGTVVEFNDPKRAKKALDAGLVKEFKGKADEVVEFDPESKKAPVKTEKKETRKSEG